MNLYLIWIGVGLFTSVLSRVAIWKLLVPNFLVDKNELGIMIATINLMLSFVLGVWLLPLDLSYLSSTTFHRVYPVIMGFICINLILIGPFSWFYTSTFYEREDLDYLPAAIRMSCHRRLLEATKKSGCFYLFAIALVAASLYVMQPNQPIWTMSNLYFIVQFLPRVLSILGLYLWIRLGAFGLSRLPFEAIAQFQAVASSSRLYRGIAALKVVGDFAAVGVILASFGVHLVHQLQETPTLAFTPVDWILKPLGKIQVCGVLVLNIWLVRSFFGQFFKVSMIDLLNPLYFQFSQCPCQWLLKCLVCGYCWTQCDTEESPKVLLQWGKLSVLDLLRTTSMVLCGSLVMLLNSIAVFPYTSLFGDQTGCRIVEYQPKFIVSDGCYVSAFGQFYFTGNRKETNPWFTKAMLIGQIGFLLTSVLRLGYFTYCWSVRERSTMTLVDEPLLSADEQRRVEVESESS